MKDDFVRALAGPNWTNASEYIEADERKVVEECYWPPDCSSLGIVQVLTTPMAPCHCGPEDLTCISYKDS